MRTEIHVKFAKLNEEARLPTQGSAQAAGWDLYALEETTVVKGASVMIPTGLACAIPEGWEGQIRCRSSLGKKGMILPNGVGTIDSDYRGEVKVLLVNLGSEDFTVTRGMRIAQLVVARVIQAELTLVSSLDETARGEGGFGSTGGR